LKIFNRTFTIIGIITNGEVTAAPANNIANPAITFIIKCPETMFANNRIPRLIGLKKNDMISITIKKGIMYDGIP
jgi:hypothetical protein